MGYNVTFQMYTMCTSQIKQWILVCPCHHSMLGAMEGLFSIYSQAVGEAILSYSHLTVQ